MSTVDFVHCNKCLAMPKTGVSIKIYFTSCFHLFCEKCINEDGAPCALCNKPKKAVELNRNVDQRILNLFQDPAKLLTTKLEAIMRKYNFQMSMVKSLNNIYKKQREKLILMQQHAQKFGAFAKEKEKEISTLKEWCETVERKLKAAETEREQMEHELAELRRQHIMYDLSLLLQLIKLRPHSGGFEPTFLFDDRSGQPPKHTFAAGKSPNLFQANENMNSSHHSSQDDSLQVISMPMGSPVCSNTSIISEITTPKLLGLHFRENGDVLTFDSQKKTHNPALINNPYVQVINQGRNSGNRSQHQRPLYTRPPPMTSTPLNGQSQATLLPNKSPNFTPNMVRVTGRIIPNTNTPSVMPF